MNYKKTFIQVLMFLPLSVVAQEYTYLSESFEDEVWANAASTVTSATGMWTTNKNVQSNEQAQDGTYSLKFSKKAGVISPMLTEGAGTLIYYAHDTNREANVEVSADKENWTKLESYKPSKGSWEKHAVAINDASVRYVRISTTSNNQYYLDNIIITKPDGTTGDGTQLVTNLRLPYFVQDFETTSQYPSSKEEAANEKAFIVEGQGEWLYKDAYRATNESYITDNSGHDLRLLKNTSYVVSPVLSQGAVRLSFNEGRRSRLLSVYVSTDEGKTWNKLKEVTTDTYNEIAIEDRSVNRVKIANDTGKGDADVDNICITAFPEGTPATVSTGDAKNITSSSADVMGDILTKGDKPLSEWGICWSLDGEPTIDKNTVKATTEQFTVTLDGLTANSIISYRAYALSLAGLAYGDVKQFTTADATMAVLTTSDVIEDEVGTDEQNIYVYAGGTIIDMGGVEPTEVGVCYGTTENPSVDGQKVKAYLGGNSFMVNIALDPQQTYYFRAYAINKAGTSYGEQKMFTTGTIVIPEYAHNVYYVSPSGDDTTADGTEQKPFYNVQRAINLVQAGDTIFMQSGTYKYSSRLNASAIGRKNSGRIALFARGGRAVLDFSEMALGDNNQGMRLTGSYWHIYGLDICGAGDNGMLIERNKPSGGGYAEVKDSTHLGHDNVIENCRFYRNQDTGLQMKNLASYNKVINCDSYFNADPDYGDADGFAVKISHGDGNYFYGCRAWNNSDDGWDGFIKTDGGFPDDITTTFEQCWAFRNGYLEDGSLCNGNGNGFKLGSAYGRNNVVLNRCLAFENYNKGFDQNHNTGSMILNNCTAYSSKDTSTKSRFTYRIDEPVASGHEVRLTNCVAISDGESDRNKSAYAVYSVVGDFITCNMNTLPEDYKTISIDGTDGERADDGTLPELDFMHIADGNAKLIDCGSIVTPYSGESRSSVGILYNGTAPDLGCFETGESSTGIGRIKTMNGNGHVSLTQTESGMVVVSVAGAEASDSYQLQVADAAGRVYSQHHFNGANTSIYLPSVRGIVMLTVSGQGMKESVKLVLGVR